MFPLTSLHHFQCDDRHLPRIPNVPTNHVKPAPDEHQGFGTRNGSSRQHAYRKDHELELGASPSITATRAHSGHEPSFRQIPRARTVNSAGIDYQRLGHDRFWTSDISWLTLRLRDHGSQTEAVTENNGERVGRPGPTPTKPPVKWPEATTNII